jgi:hypothetical protein
MIRTFGIVYNSPSFTLQALPCGGVADIAFLLLAVYHNSDPMTRPRGRANTHGIACRFGANPILLTNIVIIISCLR